MRLLPQEMAEKAEAGGVRKAALAILPLFALAVLAGAFIGLGAMFATTTYAAASTLPYGVARLLCRDHSPLPMMPAAGCWDMNTMN